MCEMEDHRGRGAHANRDESKTKDTHRRWGAHSHRAVAGRQHEAVPVEPLRVLGVVLHHLVEEEVAHGRAAHRHTGVTTLGLVHACRSTNDGARRCVRGADKGWTRPGFRDALRLNTLAMQAMAHARFTYTSTNARHGWNGCKGSCGDAKRAGEHIGTTAPVKKHHQRCKCHPLSLSPPQTPIDTHTHTQLPHKGQREAQSPPLRTVDGQEADGVHTLVLHLL